MSDGAQEMAAEVEKRRGNALIYWRILLKLSGFSGEAKVDPYMVQRRWTHHSMLERVGFQLALKGTGHATPQFEPDGDVGTENLASLERLWEAAGRPGS
jgi:hypothetical protein